MKLWQRYLLREFLAVFALFLLGFYFLYVAIDYCSHMQDFMQGKKIVFQQLCSYYFYQLIKRSDILFPLAFLIAMMKLLLGWNAKNELVAFQAAGLSWKRLVSPLFFVALFIGLSNILIAEFALPKALEQIDHFYDSHLRRSHRGRRQEPIHIIPLSDHSKLIYQYYDSALERFIDVIWICSPNDLWRMKSLAIHFDGSVEGYFVDHLEKRPEGYFEKSFSFERYLFENLKIEEPSSHKGIIPFENRSISELARLLQKNPTKAAKQEILTQLLFKVCMPFLSALVFLAVSPRCVRYARRLPFFLFYSASLFAFVAFVAFLDAAVILGETGTIAPIQAILIPFLGLLIFFSWVFTGGGTFKRYSTP